MQKDVRYTTVIKDHNKELSKLINDRKRSKALLKLKKTAEKTIFIVNFNHQDKEQAFEKFRRDVDAVILNKDLQSEVYLIINTPGGSVTAYADAAEQIKRLKKSGLKVTAFVDEIAASGGYMMAAVCDKIVAEPFAFVGSIGVVSQMPIFEDLLDKVGVQFKVYTAGTKKRTVVPTKKPTQEEEETYKEKLKEIHTAFKNHVLKYRPKIDADKLMEGDFYMAQNVINEKIVDEIGDSRSAILEAFKQGFNLLEVVTSTKKRSSGLAGLLGMESILESAFTTSIAKLFDMANPNQSIK